LPPTFESTRLNNCVDHLRRIQALQPLLALFLLIDVPDDINH
jgi:hypothetical protein